jgi:3-methyl-2-oxobutanoate hydroxymethyltransferase
MVDAGICVMGHLGLTPQNLSQLGGYKVQGKSKAAADKLVDDALALQEAGVFAILLEAMPAEAAAYVRERLDVLVYGIGAGPHVDGQLVISHDILGTFVGDIAPKFVKQYARLGGDVERVFRTYAEEVRGGHFPAPEHCYPVDPAVFASSVPVDGTLADVPAPLANGLVGNADRSRAAQLVAAS